MENVPYAISVVASIDGEEMKIGFLKKQYEEEIFELLEWGRKISVKITEQRGELVDPPTATLSLSSAVTLFWYDLRWQKNMVEMWSDPEIRHSKLYRLLLSATE